MHYFTIMVGVTIIPIMYPCDNLAISKFSASLKKMKMIAMPKIDDLNDLFWIKLVFTFYVRQCAFLLPLA